MREPPPVATVARLGRESASMVATAGRALAGLRYPLMADRVRALAPSRGAIAGPVPRARGCRLRASAARRGAEGRPALAGIVRVATVGVRVATRDL